MVTSRRTEVQRSLLRIAGTTKLVVNTSSVVASSCCRRMAMNPNIWRCLPGYFMIFMGTGDKSLWVFSWLARPVSNPVYRNQKLNKFNSRKREVRILSGSALLGHRYLQHASAVCKWDPALMYHTYVIAKPAILNDGLHLSIVHRWDEKLDGLDFV